MGQTLQNIGEKLDKVSGWAIATLLAVIFTLVGAWAQDTNIRINKIENKVPVIDKQVVQELSSLREDMAVLNTKIDILLAQHKLSTHAPGD